MQFFSLLVGIPLAGFVLSRLPFPPARKIGRAVLLVYAVAASLLTAGMVSVPFFTRADAGIGSAIFVVMAAFPGILAWLAWMLYKGSADTPPGTSLDV